LPFRADAHPAVTDLQAKTLAAIVLLQHLHLQIHAAMLGELERVAGKVEQDLAQAQAVGQRSGLQFRIKLDTQMQAPAGRHRHQQLLHRAHQCRHARGSQLRRQCLQPLAVQHVVQDLPQHLGSITHGHQHLLLAMIQIAALQPLEHAQQGAHRRADLVAHGRQEVGLGQRCLLGRTARLGQRMGARLHSAYVDPVATPLDVAAVQGQRPSMRVDPAPALWRARAEGDIDRAPRQGSGVDGVHQPRAIVGMNRCQQALMIDQGGFHADSEQRLHVACDLGKAVVAGGRATHLIDHRWQVRGHLLQALRSHAATLALAMHAPVAEGVHQHERQQGQRGRHQPAQGGRRGRVSRLVRQPGRADRLAFVRGQLRHGPLEHRDDVGAGGHGGQHRRVVDSGGRSDYQRLALIVAQRGLDLSKIGDHGIDQARAQQ